MAFSFSIVSCGKHKSKLDELDLKYNGVENVFPKTAGYAFSYSETAYPNKLLGKSVRYKLIKKPHAKITVYLYPGYLNGARNLDEAIDKNILIMTSEIKKKQKITSLTRMEKNKIKKHFDTRIAYNKLTVNKEENERIYMAQIHDQVVKIRVSSAIGENLEEMLDLFVGNVIAYLKNSLSEKEQSEQSGADPMPVS